MRSYAIVVYDTIIISIRNIKQDYSPGLIGIIRYTIYLLILRTFANVINLIIFD